MQVTRRQAVATIGGTAAAPVMARMAKGDTLDVAVIGAGVFGAWTAWHLVNAGASVALFDQYGNGHARASSAGESRVTRLGYGGDTLYSEMARDSLIDWKALSDRQRLPIFYNTGVLWFSPAGDPYAQQSIAWLKANNIPYAAGDARWLRARYPQIRFTDEETGFDELTMGALIAGRGVQAVVAETGLKTEIARIGPPERDANGLYRAGERRARALVYACGPWLPRVFPEILGGRITPTRQAVCHFGAAPGDSRFAPPALPVWADFNGGDIVYGLPDLEGQGFKIAFDGHGREVDPDHHDRRITAEDVERAREYLKRRFPDLADAPLIHARVCQYENSSNGDFLIDRLPGHDHVWLVGGGSGHGFKHGPAVGRIVAAHIADGTRTIEPRFSLATKGTVAKRTVY